MTRGPAEPTSGGEQAALAARLRAAGCVFAEDEAHLLTTAAATGGELEAMVRRREGGAPLEHILGWVELCGVRFVVEPGVFVPRRRSELMVSEAVAAARRAHGRARTPADRHKVVDLCCGCGALGAAVAAALDDVDVYAADVDPAAVRCARRNLAPFGGVVVQGDLYEPLPSRLHGTVGVLLANVPYVPTDDIALMPPEARLHEPRISLDGGPDGLEVLRRVSAEAGRWLAPAGALLVETSTGQASMAERILEGDGLVAATVADDDLGATVATGTRPSGPETDVSR